MQYNCNRIRGNRRNPEIHGGPPHPVCRMEGKDRETGGIAFLINYQLRPVLDVHNSLSSVRQTANQTCGHYHLWIWIINYGSVSKAKRGDLKTAVIEIPPDTPPRRRNKNFPGAIRPRYLLEFRLSCQDSLQTPWGTASIHWYGHRTGHLIRETSLGSTGFTTNDQEKKWKVGQGKNTTKTTKWRIYRAPERPGIYLKAVPTYKVVERRMENLSR